MCKVFQEPRNNLTHLCSYWAVAEGATSADVLVGPLPEHLQPALLAQVRRQESPCHLWLRGCWGQRAHLQVWRNHHYPGRQVNYSHKRTQISKYAQQTRICQITEGSGQFDGSLLLSLQLIRVLNLPSQKKLPLEWSHDHISRNSFWILFPFDGNLWNYFSGMTTKAQYLTKWLIKVMTSWSVQDPVAWEMM